MKKSIFFYAVTTLSLMIACGPAAENREIMHQRAKIFQDSIARTIRATLAEAETPGQTPTVVMPVDSSALKNQGAK